MSEENAELFDDQLPVVADPVAEPAPKLEWQNFRVISAKADMVFKNNPRKGLKLAFSSETNPGTRTVFKQLAYPTAQESAVASDPTGQVGPEAGLTVKEIQAARMRVAEWKRFEKALEIPSGLSLSAIAKAIEGKVVELKAKQGKNYKDAEGNEREGQVEIDLLANKPNVA